LFDVMLNLQNVDGRELAIPGLTLSPYQHENVTSKFDLILTVVVEDTGGFLFSLNYSTTLFKQETIERFINYFKRLTDTLTENKQQRLSQIELLSGAEKRQILEDFNNTQVDYPKDKTIHQLFEEQVEKTPNHTALEIETCYLTYGELNKRANHLAHKLRQKNGCAGGTIVGIIVDRSIRMVIGILGVLKSGGAYLPIDPGYPPDRINYMLTESHAKLLLTTKNRYLNEWDAVYLDDFDKPSTGHWPSVDIGHPSSSRLAYVMYTSGSTGKPKGVMVEHRSVVNVLTALQRQYPLTGTDTYLLKTSYSFDVSITELFGWYLVGGRLAIAGSDVEKDPVSLLEVIEKQKVTHINFVPSMFNVFIDELTPDNVSQLSGLRYIFLAGEALLPKMVDKFRRLNTKIILENLYGPTEGTVYASRYSLSYWDGIGSVLIGKPLPNIRIYILDRNHNLQPVGVPGELVISGMGVARGYLNRTQL
ncbi:MAG: amino acid adenylation domain-containing protein, partial [bacterium]|nr:amino acid adenylation domain-containing protein [bacterium]